MEDPFEDEILIKQNPELRHVLAHILNALEELAHSRPGSALDELRCVRGLVAWEGEPDEIEEEIQAMAGHGKGHKGGKRGGKGGKRPCKGR